MRGLFVIACVVSYLFWSGPRLYTMAQGEPTATPTQTQLEQCHAALTDCKNREELAILRGNHYATEAWKSARESDRRGTAEAAAIATTEFYWRQNTELNIKLAACQVAHAVLRQTATAAARPSPSPTWTQTPEPTATALVGASRGIIGDSRASP